MKLQCVRTLLCLLITTLLSKASIAPALIPLPQKMEARAGAFYLTPDMQIDADTASIGNGKFLAERLRNATHYSFKTRIHKFRTEPTYNSILLTTKNANTNLGDEGYELLVAT